MSAVLFLPDEGTLIFGTPSTEYICQLVIGVVTNDQPENIIEAMCGSEITYGTERFFLDLDYFQDWHATGISTYFWNTANTVTTFLFKPHTSLTPGMTGNVRIKRPGAFSGAPREPARDRIRHAIIGEPTLIVAA